MSEKFRGSIRGFSLTGKGGIKFSYVKHRRIGTEVDNVTVTEQDPRSPHPKLKSRMRGLLAHAILIGQFQPKGKKMDETYIKEKSIVNDPDFKEYEVYGLTLKGTEEGESVTLLLRKRMINDNWGKIVIPSVKMYNDDEYTFSGNLEEEVQEVLDEVIKYINSGNDQDLQAELFGDSEEEEEEI